MYRRRAYSHATALFTAQASRLASLATRRLEEGQIVGVYWQKALSKQSVWYDFGRKFTRGC